MKKIFFLILMLVLISSCADILRLQGRDRAEQLIRTVNKGTDGLVGSFRENSPPKEIKPERRYRLVLELHNQGAYDIPRGFYSCFGFGTDEMTVEPKSGTYRIRGRELGNPVGEKIIQRAELIAQKVRAPIELKAYLCYPYQTIASAQICIDTDPANERRIKKPCTIKTETFSGGQGGPVGITKIETLSMQDHPDFEERLLPEFKIFIDNFGKGDIVNTVRLQEICRGSAAGKPIVQVDARLSAQRMECDREVKINEEEESFITCSIPEGIDSRAGTYTAPLTVTMDYGYRDFVSTTLEVER